LKGSSPGICEYRNFARLSSCRTVKHTFQTKFKTGLLPLQLVFKEPSISEHTRVLESEKEPLPCAALHSIDQITAVVAARATPSCCSTPHCQYVVHRYDQRLLEPLPWGSSTTAAGMGQTAVVALWLCGLVVVFTAAATAGGSSCPQPLTPANLPPQCQQLSRVCVDHSVCVLYDNRPSSPANELPRINGSHTLLNHPPGVDNAWGSSFPHPGPVLRPAAPAASEETRELSHPSFSSCTIPLVIYADHLHSYSDFFINTAARLAMLQLNNTLDVRCAPCTAADACLLHPRPAPPSLAQQHSLHVSPHCRVPPNGWVHVPAAVVLTTCRLTLVVDTFGLKLQPFHRFLLSPLSAFRVTTLSHLSSRMPLSKPERYNPDGQHVRCFR
jgi:hypothetical protein